MNGNPKIKFIILTLLLFFSFSSQAEERRLLFYAVDGVALRIFEFARDNNLIPNLQGLMKPENGGAFRIGKSHPKGVTAAGWATHFYGTNREHGWNYYDNKTPTSSINSNLPHLFTQILHADPQAKVALFGSSESAILERVLKLKNIKKNNPEEWKRYAYARYQGSDEMVITRSVKAIKSGMDTLSYVLDIDDTGHKFGAESAEYLRALMKKDYELGLLLRAVSKSPFTWDIVVATDHGFESSEVPAGMSANRSVRQHGEDPKKRHLMTDNSRLIFSIFNSSQGVTIDGPHNAEDTLASSFFLRTGLIAKTPHKNRKKIRRLNLTFSNRFKFIRDDVSKHPVNTFDLGKSRLRLPTNLLGFESRFPGYTSNPCRKLSNRDTYFQN